MDQTFLVSTIQAGGGDVMEWGTVSQYTSDPLKTIERGLNAVACLRIVDTIGHIYPCTDGHSSRIMLHVRWSSQTGSTDMSVSL